VVVDNRAGAGGSTGAAAVAQGPADGYTLLVGSNGPLTINPFVQTKLAYRPLDDFAPIALVGAVPHVLVATQNLPAKTLEDLVGLSKRQFVGCATSGVGSSTHLTLARFTSQTGARIQHIPYRGGGSFIQDLLSGELQIAAMEFSTALALHKGGKARILGVASSQRSQLAPDVPTFIEGGIAGFTAQSYVGLLAPAQTPAPVRRTLETAALAALGSPETAERLQEMGMQLAEPAERTAAGFSKFLRADYARSRDAAAAAGIKPE
jgi:tripartite-type tricarboxylate transporter receptor subunit TctC